MDRLWAPWRVKYLKIKKGKICVFCEAGKYRQKNYVFLKTAHSIALLNIFPYNNGHIMVSPIRHVNQLSKLKEEEILDLFRTLNRAKEMLDKVLKPEGYNIGINLSRAGGAGIVGHLHLHLVPRWLGDTNFMPALNATKIISQSLRELHKRLMRVKSSTD